MSLKVNFTPSFKQNSYQYQQSPIEKNKSANEDKTNCSKKMLLTLSGIGVVVLGGLWYLKTKKKPPIKPPKSPKPPKPTKPNPTGGSPTAPEKPIIKPTITGENPIQKPVEPAPKGGRPNGTSPAEKPVTPKSNPTGASPVEKPITPEGNPTGATPVEKPVTTGGNPAGAAPVEKPVTTEGNPTGAAPVEKPVNAEGNPTGASATENPTGVEGKPVSTATPTEKPNVDIEQPNNKTELSDKELKKAQRRKEKLAQEAKNTKIVTLENGTQVKRVITYDKNGKKIVRHYSLKDNRLISELRDGNILTIYNGNAKITYIESEGKSIEKIYAKNKNGKYELVERRSSNLDAQTTKTVRRLENGNTEILEENSSEIVRTVRNKKGTIVSTEHLPKSSSPKPPVPPETIKVFDPWYIEYKKLCRYYGVEVRESGAWDHFYELTLRKYDPEAYESYLRVRKYRAKYDEKAARLEALDRRENMANDITISTPTTEIYQPISAPIIQILA